MKNEPTVVALAVLYHEGKFLMQLRDDFPHILYPGYWGLFGGHLESGETPEEGLKRELTEEINYEVPNLAYFCCDSDETVIRHIYHAPLTVPLEYLKLSEGQDLGLVTPEDIRQGFCYSYKIEQIRPLGLPHQKILLDFLSV